MMATSGSDPSTQQLDRKAANWRVWDTDLVPSRRRFTHYREGACETFLSMSPERGQSDEFAARLEHLPLPNGAVNFVDSVPHVIVRNTADVARMTDDVYHLNFQISGRSVYSIRNHDIGIAPRSCLLFKSTIPFRKVMDPERRNTLLSLVIPATRLADVVPLNDIGDYALLSNTTHGNLLQSSLGILASRLHTAMPTEIAALSAAAVNILSAALSSMKTGEQVLEHQRQPSHSLYPLMVSYIREHLKSRELTPNSVAQAFHLSRRYVDAVFARASGLTASKFILQERLTNAQLDLTNAFSDHLTILDIALRWGFEDVSTFHRTFRAHFGDTPGSLRSSKSV
ncbi:AraC family transcriptional regulator [Saccharospirillum mangrovi]|uniref:AraC family transcriptional regulator n=1 Tax=Saccharospirillum mangrovi TaxID=2161747 RepID=UPI000D334E66|nr:AraC family transcriptional regulator [Saccharospirillum mangrovi]